ncbi:MAG: glycosyltransferase family 39 protein [Planctomycetes bacterium]|nr:glycosyltransferase family 39 protein [Planctomycetota bacterium]
MTDTDKIVATRPLPYFWPAVLILALAACMLVLFATSGQGIGVSPDSVFYLEGAENLRAGRGYTSRQPGNVYAPITHWPPGYSFALTASSFGGEVLDAARRLNALLFALNVLLAGVIIRRLGGRDWAGLLAAALVATAPPMIELHTTAWSEPLFFTLALGACACLASFRRNGRWAPLLLSAFLAGLSVVVRFAGAALVAAMLLALIAMLGSQSQFLLKRRLKAAAFTLVALVPMSAWLISRGSGAAGASRKIGFLGLPTGQHLSDAAHSMSVWLLPDEVPSWLRGGLLIVVALLALAVCVQVGRGLVRGWRNARPTDPADSALRFIVLFAVCYAGLVVGSVVFLDPEIVFDSRTLSPLYVCSALAAPLPAATQRNRRAVAAIAAAIMAMTIAGAARSALAASAVNRDGLWLNSRAWRQSPIIARLNALPANTLVFTNQIAAVRFLTKCDVLATPPVLTTNRPDGGPPKVHPEYALRMRKVLQTVTSRGGAVATFHAPEWYYGLSEEAQTGLLAAQVPAAALDELAAIAQGGDLVEARNFEEGSFYVYAPPQMTR